jgi:hypothetical protein
MLSCIVNLSYKCLEETKPCDCLYNVFIIIPPLPEGGEGYTVLPLSVSPSKIFFVKRAMSRFFAVEMFFRRHRNHIFLFSGEVPI